MTKWIFMIVALVFTTTAWADNNVSKATDTNGTEAAATVNPEQLDKHVKEQMEREEKYARTQSFEQGDDYNLSEHQVDPKDLDNVPVIEPLYDFNMDDVYD